MGFRKEKMASFFLVFVMSVSQMSNSISYAAGTITKTDVLEDSTHFETLPEHKSYFTEETLEASGISSRYAIPDGEVDFVKNQNSFSITFQFKTTTSGLQALGAINSTTHANSYISFYLNTVDGKDRLGMELRDAQTKTNEHQYVELENTFRDGNWHTVTYVIKENDSYQIYLDKEQVMNVDAPTTKFTGSAGWWEPSSVTLAGANRIKNNNFPYNGSIRNVTMYQGALTQEQIIAESERLEKKVYLSDYLYQYEDFSFTEQSDLADISIDAADIAALEKGTISFAYRLDEAVKDSADEIVLLSLSDDIGKKGYLYMIPESGKIGVSVDGEEKRVVTLTDKTAMRDTEYHSIVVAFDGVNAIFFFDGENVGTVEVSGNLLSAEDWNVTNAALGGIPNTQDTAVFAGDMDTVYVYDTVLNEEMITSLHTKQMEKTEAFKTAEYGMFDRGDYGVFGYRIPALTTTKEGTLLAGTDERNSVRTGDLLDCGNIDTILRRSTDGGVTWEDPVEVIDLKSQPYDTGSNSTVLIDPCFISTEEGRIWMLVDMFPESRAALGFNDGTTKGGTGYVEVDGVKYQGLYETVDGQDVLRGTLRGDTMYDLEGNPTEYTIDMGSGEDAYHTKGDMYYKGEYVGNIYLHSQNANNDSAPYHVLVTMYTWLTYSDDDGKTWSNPVDVTPMIKEEWMKFCGAGPGVGLELKHGEHKGRLVFPIYYTNNSSGIGFQSSACIYSDDGGITWHRGESPNDGRINASGEVIDSQNPSGVSQLTESQIIELNNGHLLQFMRNTGGNGKVAVARSTDGGETWEDPYDTDATDIYCQLSVLHYPELVDGKELIVMSNSAGPGRYNGILRIGEIGEDDSITWIHENMFCAEKYAYSCLSYIGDGKIGLLYEHLGDNIKFTSFNLEYIRQGEGDMAPHITTVTRTIERTGNDTPITDINVDAMVGDTLKFTVDFDQDVLVKGTPKFRFRIGGYGGETRYADFVERGEGKRQLIFAYQVTEKDAGMIDFTGPKIISDAENYVRNRENYSVSSGGDRLTLGNIDASAALMTKADDIPYADMIITAGSEQSGEEISRAFDSDKETLWHSDWNGTSLTDMWVKFDLQSEKQVTGLRYLPRQDNSVNGRIVKYEVQVSNDDQKYTKVAEGTWTADTSWKEIKFDELQNVRYVKLVALQTNSDTEKVFVSAAELRLTSLPIDSVDDDNEDLQEIAKAKESLNVLITTANGKVQEAYTQESWSAFVTILQTAKDVSMNADATKDAIEKAAEDLQKALENLVLAETGDNTGQGESGTIESSQGEGGEISTSVEQPEEIEAKELQVAKAELQVIVNNAGNRKQTDYTESSWKNYTDTYQQVKSVLANPNATKAQLETAKESLSKAIDNLTLKQKESDHENEKQKTDKNIAIKKGEKFKDKTGTYQFKVKNSKEAIFTGVSKNVAKVNIPNTVTYKGKVLKVTAIAEKALKNNKKVTNVVIGKNVTTIGSSAFEGCSKLKKITLGSKVADIQSKAFKKCTSLTGIVIPKTVTNIGSSAFEGCSKLKKIALGSKVVNIRSKVFKNCTSLTAIVIPKAVTNIGISAFEGCKKLAKIDIKATKLKKVQKNAFKGIKKTAKITVPKGKLKAYRKLLQNKGQSKQVKVYQK